MHVGKKYPDPEAVVYPTAYPPKYACQLTSYDAGELYPEHDHSAFADRHGNGSTDTVASHFHRIRDGKVLPDASDGHTHRLTGLPCGAG